MHRRYRYIIVCECVYAVFFLSSTLSYSMIHYILMTSTQPCTLWQKRRGEI